MAWKVIDPITGTVKFIVELIAESSSWSKLFWVLFFLPFVYFVFGLIMLGVWVSLEIACLSMTFSKPLRAILGAAIPVFSIYIAYCLVEKGLIIPGVSELEFDYFGCAVITGNHLVFWLCATVVWLAPLSALSKKPYCVLMGFTFFWMGIFLFFHFIPLIASHYSLLDRNVFDFESHIILICSLAMIILGILGCLITIVIPFLLVKAGFEEDKEAKKNVVKKEYPDTGEDRARKF